MSTEEPQKKSNRRRSRRRPNQQKDQNKDQPRNQQRSRSSQRNRRKGNQKSGQRNSKWNRHRISDHFMKRDFDSRKKDCSCGSSLRISLGLVGIIEALRAKINKRIEIVTGYYCPDCRERQYGIKRDFHHAGVAADIRVTDMPVVDLFLIAETYPELKGIGINFDDNHLHIDTRKEDDRQTWVEINDEWIELTPENRDEYIKQPVLTNESSDTDS
ncbi:hypothetical protein DID73_02415 [Candidatus Marinamargulisbacteria bacterium SCGC AG-343-K17]|nr:hypothetical protein DID73_02415 [Candidatus Marinamargulisbacteria bacterium SCGC AG-343-K17]